jgi:hypothetical protein
VNNGDFVAPYFIAMERLAVLRADVLVQFSTYVCQRRRGLLMFIKVSHEAVNTRHVSDPSSGYLARQIWDALLFVITAGGPSTLHNRTRP